MKHFFSKFISRPTLFVLFMCACSHRSSENEANAYMHQSDFKDLLARFESPERSKWQKPKAVLEVLGELKGQRIMDLGAGTGYFAFLLAEAGAQVIAADVDKKFLTFMQEKKNRLQLSSDQLEIRSVAYDDPNLKAGEIDIFFSVDVFHHLENRVEYFKKVYQGLQAEGKVFIVDFKKEETPHGPPLKMRLEESVFIQELKAAGFSDLEVIRDLLPEQNIYLGYKK